jgi:hypothetical protein
MDHEYKVEREATPEVYYFGCWGNEAGHYLHGSNGRLRWRDEESLTPWGMKCDGVLCPYGTNGPQGVVAHHHKDGWTAIAFWDRSIDSRPGSNSVFFIHAEVTAEEAWRLAQEKFPQVCGRFKFEIKLPKERTPHD